MERLPSILNKLTERYHAGATPAELLLLLEDMRRELSAAHPVADHTGAPVAVWLPAGYSPLHQPGAQGLPPDALQQGETDMQAADGRQTTTDALTGSADSPRKATATATLQVPEVAEAPVPQPTQLQQDEAKRLQAFLGVPKPPQVPLIIETIGTSDASNMPAPEPMPLENETAALAAPGLPVAPEPPVFEPRYQPAFAAAAGQDAAQDEGPIVLELSVPEAVVFEPEIAEPETPVVSRLPEAFLRGAGYRDTLVAEKPKELHEILAGRVVAAPTGAGKNALADKLAGTRIQDLRKAFSINDRFRFTQSLFRGDEAMFDRAIKTINNFGILAEAQYWIQRELVIKLGWNEEDELVQHFYQLVNRRFL